MKFSLIICGYNEEKALDQCIQSCLNLEYPKNEYEILYIDNNSKDSSIKVAQKYPINVFIEHKQGLSEARNCGINIAKGEILVFLDADLKLDSKYLKFHETTFVDDCVGAGGGMVMPLIKTWVSDYLGVSLFEGYPRFLKQKYISTYPGCNLSIRKSVIGQVGPFKEGLISESGITRFAEDKEMCERIRGRGYQIKYNPAAIVFHENAFTFRALFRIWVKGARGRLNMIKIGKKDVLSLFFGYNLPLVFLAIILIAAIFNKPYFYILLFAVLVCLVSACIKAFIETGLFVESIIIKPWLDLLSIFTIGLTITAKRIGLWR